MSQEKRDYYRYQSFMMEPWDGPAAICFCDGTRIGGMLDRNGLRPARYCITKDGRVVLTSEVGAVRLEPKEVLSKGRLEPGKMLLIDTEQKRIVPDAEVKHISGFCPSLWPVVPGTPGGSAGPDGGSGGRRPGKRKPDALNSSRLSATPRKIWPRSWCPWPGPGRSRWVPWGWTVRCRCFPNSRCWQRHHILNSLRCSTIISSSRPSAEDLRSFGPGATNRTAPDGCHQPAPGKASSPPLP